MVETVVSRDIIMLAKADFDIQDSVAGALTEVAAIQVPQGVRYILHPDLPVQILADDGVNPIILGALEIRKENATRKRHLTALSSDLAYMQGDAFDKNQQQKPEQATVFKAGEWMTIFINGATAVDVSDAGTIFNVKVIEESVVNN